MSDSSVDPVTLIVGPSVEPSEYRCPNCRIIDYYAAALPVGGETCRRCNAHISPGDVVVYAGLMERFAAIMMDVILTAGLTALPVLLVVGPVVERLTIYENPAHPARELIRNGFLAMGGFVALAHLWYGNARGQTIGKRLAGIKVVGVDSGDALGWEESLPRTLWQVVTLAPFGLGMLAAIPDRRRRALHDRLAGTVVVER